MCGELPLKEVFPLLYSIAWNKEAFVAEHLCWQNGFVHWDVLFIRMFQDWELESLNSFFALLYSIEVGQSEEDKVAWFAARSGSFEVKSYYKL